VGTTASIRGAGFVLDGYPRTGAQVDEPDRTLDKLGSMLDAAVLPSAYTDAIVSRPNSRASEQERDDAPDVVRQRIGVYAIETSPVAEAYAAPGLLLTVDGSGPMDEVTERIPGALSISSDRRDLTNLCRHEYRLRARGSSLPQAGGQMLKGIFTGRGVMVSGWVQSPSASRSGSTPSPNQ
jgi:hypothetical protein